jgi:hypothetical protein
MHKQIQKLIQTYSQFHNIDPAVLTSFTQAVAHELGEIVVASPYNEGVHMYFDEKIARYEIKTAAGL